MTLTPTLKALLIASAFLVNMGLLIWMGIKVDALSLGMKEAVFNIGLTVLTVVNAGMTGILAYLGLRAPTIEGNNILDSS